MLARQRSRREEARTPGQSPSSHSRGTYLRADAPVQAVLERANALLEPSRRHTDAELAAVSASLHAQRVTQAWCLKELEAQDWGREGVSLGLRCALKVVLSTSTVLELGEQHDAHELSPHLESDPPETSLDARGPILDAAIVVASPASPRHTTSNPSQERNDSFPRREQGPGGVGVAVVSNEGWQDNDEDVGIEAGLFLLYVYTIAYSRSLLLL